MAGYCLPGLNLPTDEQPHFLPLGAVQRKSSIEPQRKFDVAGWRGLLLGTSRWLLLYWRSRNAPGSFSQVKQIASAFCFLNVAAGGGKGPSWYLVLHAGMDIEPGITGGFDLSSKVWKKHGLPPRWRALPGPVGYSGIVFTGTIGSGCWSG